MTQETQERRVEGTQDPERHGGNAMPLSAGSITEQRASWTDIAVFIVVGGIFAAIGAAIARGRAPPETPPQMSQPIHERKLPLWLDITIANVSAFAMGVLAIEACEHKVYICHCLAGVAGAMLKII